MFLNERNKKILLDSNCSVSYLNAQILKNKQFHKITSHFLAIIAYQHQDCTTNTELSKLGIGQRYIWRQYNINCVLHTGKYNWVNTIFFILNFMDSNSLKTTWNKASNYLRTYPYVKCYVKEANINWRLLKDQRYSANCPKTKMLFLTSMLTFPHWFI